MWVCDCIRTHWVCMHTMELIHGDFFHTASNSSNLPCGRVIRYYQFFHGDFLPKNFPISDCILQSPMGSHGLLIDCSWSHCGVLMDSMSTLICLVKFTL
jgi:hypothetical protein